MYHPPFGEVVFLGRSTISHKEDIFFNVSCAMVLYSWTSYPPSQEEAWHKKTAFVSRSWSKKRLDRSKIEI
jgi:hypothetical protein